MQITHLARTSAEHVTVIFEDDTKIASTLNVCTELILFTGKDLSDEEVETLRHRSAVSLTLEKAVSLLQYRSMSGREMRDKLIRKGADRDVAEAVLERLYELRLLDDETYAASVARHYMQKGYGAGRIRAELSRRGISRDSWDEAIASAPDGTDRLDALLRRKLKDPEDRDEVRKVSASLYRRGYSWEEIRSALERYSIDTEEY